MLSVQSAGEDEQQLETLWMIKAGLICPDRRALALTV